MVCVECDRSLPEEVISMAEIATFGAGCFWGVEAAFQRIPGVIDTAVGYSGGGMANPTSKEVFPDETGHAGGMEVTVDSAKGAYEQMLEAFSPGPRPNPGKLAGPD